MKINGQIPKYLIDKKTEAPSKNAKGISEKEESRLSGYFKASPEGFTVNRIKDKIEAEPDMDLQKVKELKARIKSGNYKVDPEKLANNLLKDSLLEDLA